MKKEKITQKTKIETLIQKREFKLSEPVKVNTERKTKKETSERCLVSIARAEKFIANIYMTHKWIPEDEALQVAKLLLLKYKDHVPELLEEIYKTYVHRFFFSEPPDIPGNTACYLQFEFNTIDSVEV